MFPVCCNTFQRLHDIGKYSARFNENPANFNETSNTSCNSETLTDIIQL